MPSGSKWCPDCDTVKPVSDFPTTTANSSGVYTYCKPCHNVRGKASKDRVGGSRTYHLQRRYGITAEEADAMLAAQKGRCAVCRTAPAAHVDHDHATGRVRQLLCFNCNGGLGQFRDDPAVLRAAAEYVERHRDAQRGSGDPQRPSRGRRRSPAPGASALRHRGAGCTTHDVVRGRVAKLVAALERPAAG
ncbi:endonuclease VII domain-containing protein [Geodermatophilus sp. SYSU D00766]